MTDDTVIQLSQVLEASVIDHIVVSGTSILVYRLPASKSKKPKTIIEIEEYTRNFLSSIPKPDESRLAFLAGMLGINIIGFEVDAYEPLERFKENDQVIAHFVRLIKTSTPEVAKVWLIENIKRLEPKTRDAFISFAALDALREQSGRGGN